MESSVKVKGKRKKKPALHDRMRKPKGTSQANTKVEPIPLTKRRIAIFLATLAGFLFLLLVGAEFILRWSGFDHPLVKSPIPQFVFAQNFLTDSENFALDSELFWRYRPSRRILRNHSKTIEYTTNSRGFRGPEFLKEKKPGALRIAFLGDSNTFGLHLPVQMTLEQQVAELMEQKGLRPVEVLNFGVMGYSSFQGLRLFEREVLSFQPDVVVAWFGINDSQPAFTPDSRVLMPWPPLLAATQRLQSLKLFQLLRFLLGRAGIISETKDESETLTYRVSPEEFSTNLAKFRMICKQRKILLIVPDYPSLLFKKAEKLNEIIPQAHRLGVTDVAGREELDFYSKGLVLSTAHRIDEVQGKKILILGPAGRPLSGLVTLPLDTFKKEWLTVYTWARQLKEINLKIPEDLRLPLIPLIEKEDPARCFIDLSHQTPYGYGIVANEILRVLEREGLVKIASDKG